MLKSAPCQEVIEKDNPDLLKFPIIKCWPHDGQAEDEGRFITLPMVFTKDPETGRPNCGMYRIHIYDKKTTGMHWHIHKDGARHYEKYKKIGMRMPAAIAVGGDPAVIYSASAIARVYRRDALCRFSEKGSGRNGEVHNK